MGIIIPIIPNQLDWNSLIDFFSKVHSNYFKNINFKLKKFFTKVVSFLVSNKMI